MKAGLEEARKRIREEWVEITAVAQREILSELPGTMEEFIDDLRAGTVPVDAMKELGGIQSCSRCGIDILRPEQAAAAVLEHYGNPDIEVDLEALFEAVPEAESVDVGGVCSYCGHQILKDD